MVGTIWPAPMSQSRVDTVAARLARPLPFVIAAVGTLGLLSAALVDPSPVPASTRRAAPGEAGTDVTAVAPDGAVAVPGAPGDPAAVPGGTPTETAPAAAGPPVEALGPSNVPTPGTYTYRVESSRDGTSTTQEEQREIVQLSGDRTRGLVEITARLEGESQVSVVDWSPEAALVRSTRISSPDAAGRDCTWEPPFPEFGTLAPGSSWTLDSTCRSDVTGIDTTFRITGTGRVVGTASVAGVGGDVAVWQIERDRTTTITAVVAGDELVQKVHERGVVFFDPARGVVVRSDLTSTLEGAQTGVTQRKSQLTAIA